MAAMSRARTALFALALAPFAPPQHSPPPGTPDEPGPVEAPQAIAARIRAGGRFEASRWRRGQNGALEMFFFADAGMLIPGRDNYVPLLRDGFEHEYDRHSGAVATAAMLCHGHGDLLGMTDAVFHFEALGIDTSDIALRQLLGQAISEVADLDLDDDLDRARTFDLMLAIDLLERRGVKGAVAECMGLARADAPEPLRRRAERATKRLRGEAWSPPRRRLDPATLKLPLGFDAAILVDHARLPDVSWLTRTGRQFAAHKTAYLLVRAGGPVTPAQRNGAQWMADQIGELPFAFAHRFGNIRLDHSCVIVRAQNDADFPAIVSWQAAGELEPRRRPLGEPTRKQQLKRPRLLNAEIEFFEDGLLATKGGSAGKPRPDRARQLLQGPPTALRIVLPERSKVWPLLRALDLPAIRGGEIRIDFDDRGMRLAIELTARDEIDAEDFVTRVDELRPTIAAERLLPWQLREDAQALAFATRVHATELEIDDNTIRAEVRADTFTLADVQRLVLTMTGVDL